MDFSVTFCIGTSLCSSSFVVAFLSLALNIVGKTAPLKSLVRRVLLSFALSTSFIMVNAFYIDSVLQEISAHMSLKRKDV